MIRYHDNSCDDNLGPDVNGPLTAQAEELPHGRTVRTETLYIRSAYGMYKHDFYYLAVFINMTLLLFINMNLTFWKTLV